jgi:hypothetical protein|nr:hypothetical protein [uncultured bacterium]
MGAHVLCPLPLWALQNQTPAFAEGLETGEDGKRAGINSYDMT